MCKLCCCFSVGAVFRSSALRLDSYIMARDSFANNLFIELFLVAFFYEDVVYVVYYLCDKMLYSK